MTETTKADKYSVFVYGLSEVQAQNLEDLVLQRIMTEGVTLNVTKSSTTTLDPHV